MGAACSTEWGDESEGAGSRGAKAQAARNSKAHQTVRHWHDKMMMSAASQAVFEAAQRGDSRKVHAALNAHGDPNCVNFAGYSALMLSVGGGYIEVVAMLLQATADPNRGILGVTPLMMAAASGQLEAARMLVNSGAAASGACQALGRTALHRAAQRGYGEVVRLLIQAGMMWTRGLVPAEGGVGPPRPVDLTPIDLARLEIFRRVCFRRVGATPDSPGMVAAAPAAVAQPPAPIAGTGTSRKPKMSAIVDQTLNAEVQPLEHAEVTNMYQSYQAKYGAAPSPESEPTADQLAAVRQLVSSGSSPYIDMAVYGPQGLRRLRKLTFASYSLNSVGEWARKEMPGPPDWESWSEVYRCIRTTFLLLETIAPERLDGYSEFIRSLHARFGHTCWDIIYLGDVHMRSEHFERIRRKLEQNPNHGYTTANPWNAVYAQAILEDSFWSKEVITPATLRLARGSAPARKKRQKVKDSEDQSKHNGTLWTHNKRGAEICEKWNQGDVVCLSHNPSVRLEDRINDKKPLRSPTELEGIKDGLTAQEKKKLQEGNEHTSFSADVMVTAIGSGTSFALENPEPLNEVSIFNMPKIQAILRQHEVKCVDFDQCRYGAETKKPTRLAFDRVDHKGFNGSRCNHVKKEWKDKDRKTYMAPHERLAGRKRKSADGREEFASKALGNYPAKFCKALAENIARVETERAREARGPPESLELGVMMRDLLDTGITQCPSFVDTADDIFEGKEKIREMDEGAVNRIKEAFQVVLEAQGLNPVDGPTEAELIRPLDGWTNWPSAEEESADLHRLIRDAESKGFCRVISDEKTAKQILGEDPILNKLGVVVKFSGSGDEVKKKSRIIWDMRESKVNSRCDPAERIILPRLLDVVSETLTFQANYLKPVFAAIDIQDAFHNVPAGRDKRYTAARCQMEDNQDCFIVYYDVLVFGSKSSPTVWGRFAAYLGRIVCSILPEVGVQIYVDDPIFVLPDSSQESRKLFALVLLILKIFGFPVKLEKASAGSKVKWIGATLEAGESELGPFTEVTIPPEKVEKLLGECQNFLKAPVVGASQLRSFAGSMAFVAGLVPVLRPFLAPLWAALPKGAANDGGSRLSSPGKSRSAGKLVHTKRIATSLHWIAALLRGEHGSLRRRFEANKQDDGWEVITDACPWGIGGVLYRKSIPVRWFSAPLSSELLEKFSAQKGDPGMNTAWEALALLVALRLWLPKLPKQISTRIKSDNVGALRMLLKMTSPSGPLSTIAREIALDVAADNYQIAELEHVPGITNVAADALSRLWAPQPEPLPNLGEAVQDLAPNFDSSFWKVS
eukprot:symbB.v1.2.034605.t1/scaffold4499.1/size38882/7